MLSIPLTVDAVGVLMHLTFYGTRVPTVGYRPASAPASAMKYAWLRQLFPRDRGPSSTPGRILGGSTAIRAANWRGSQNHGQQQVRGGRHLVGSMSPSAVNIAADGHPSTLHAAMQAHTNGLRWSHFDGSEFLRHRGGSGGTPEGSRRARRGGVTAAVR